MLVDGDPVEPVAVGLGTDEGEERGALDLGSLGDEWIATRRRPLPYETSRPGLFAVGDLRSGSTKRVAAAVGEGSAAVRSVHEHLALTPAGA